MKRLAPVAGFIALAGALTGPVASADGVQPLPTPFPESRYREMSARSPFSVASATEPAAAATPGFASQLYLDGVAHVGSTDFVAIKSRDPDKPAVLFVEVGQSTDDGMKVERVKWSDVMGKSTVDVVKGGEKATLIFDEQQMAKPVDQGPPVVTVRGQPDYRLPMIPSSAPVQSPLLNRVRTFPQPQAGGGPVPPNPVPGADVRRRVRVIQTGQ